MLVSKPGPWNVAKAQRSRTAGRSHFQSGLCRTISRGVVTRKIGMYLLLCTILKAASLKLAHRAARHEWQKNQLKVLVHEGSRK